MEPKEQTQEEIRYYRLKGEAKIAKAGELVKVILLGNDNPKLTPLHFDFVLEGDNKITAEAFSKEGKNVAVDFTAGFDKKWFDIAKDDGFVFRKNDTVIKDYTELIKQTKEDNMDDMSRVKPGKVAGNKNDAVTG